MPSPVSFKVVSSVASKQKLLQRQQRQTINTYYSLMASVLLVVLLLLLMIVFNKGANAQAFTSNTVQLLLGPSASPGSQEVLERIIHRFNEMQRSMFTLKATVLNHSVDNAEITKMLCHAMKRKMLALFGNMDRQQNFFLHDLTRIFHLPFFTWHDASRTETLQYNNSFVFYMRPSLLEPLADLVEFYKWPALSYIYSTTNSFHRGTELIKLLHMKKGCGHVTIDMRRVNLQGPRHSNTAVLRSLDRWLVQFSRRYIVIDVEGTQNTQRLLEELLQFGMNRAEYHYILVDLSISEIPMDNFIYSGVNISGFELFDYNNQTVSNKIYYLSKTFLLNKSKPSENPPPFEVALMYDAFDLFLTNLQTAISTHQRGVNMLNHGRDCYSAESVLKDTTQLQPFAHGSIIKDLMSTRAKRGLTGNLLFNNAGQRINYDIIIKELQETQQGTKKLKLVGRWNSMEGLKMNYFLNNTYTFKNRTVKVVAIISKPFVQYKKEFESSEPQSGKEHFEGFCMDLAHAIFEKLNMEWDLYLVKDKAYGGLVLNKSSESNNSYYWNGMMGDVVSNKTGSADIAIAPLTITAIRQRDVWFSEPYMTFGLSVLYRKPSKEKPGSFSFGRPLDYHVWLGITIATVFVSLGLCIISRISPLEWTINTVPTATQQKKDATVVIEREFDLFNSLWFSFAAFVGQGVDISPTSPGARILSSLWWAFSLILIAYYTANLAAFLTVAVLRLPFQNIDDLVSKNNSGVSVGTLRSGSTYAFFESSKTGTYNKVFKMMMRDPSVFVNQTEHGIEKVRRSNGKYAFIMESKMNEYINNRDPCDTMMVGSEFGPNNYGIAVHRGTTNDFHFHLKEQITHAVLKLREEQKLAVWYKKWWIEMGQCTDPENAELQPLALNNLSGAFYILITGLSFAIFIAMCELCHIVYKRSSQNKAANSARDSNKDDGLVACRQTLLATYNDTGVDVENFLEQRRSCHLRNNEYFTQSGAVDDKFQQTHFIKSSTLPPPPPPPSQRIPLGSLTYGYSSLKPTAVQTTPTPQEKTFDPRLSVKNVALI